MVATRTAIDWPWSSVAAHVEGRHDALLTREPLVQRVGPAMRAFFDIDVGEEAQRKLRLASSTGRPLGAAAWVKALETTTGRSLAARPVGRLAAHLVLARSSRMETLDPNPLVPAWRRTGDTGPIA